MKNILTIAIAIVSFQLAIPAAYAWGQPPPKPVPENQQQQGQSQGQGQGQDQQSVAGAAARAASNANVGVTTGPVNAKTGDQQVKVAGSTLDAKTGDQQVTTNLQAKTGDQQVKVAGSTLDNTSGNGNGAKVDTTNNSSSRFLYVNLPTMPAVAPTVTGTGGVAVSSQCGPLKEIFQKPIQYLLVGYFGIKTITLDGQFTDVLGPVIGENGKVKEFDVVNNRDGSISEWGTIYTEAAIIVSSSVSKQFGIGAFGGSGGGTGSNGVAGTITGTERIIALGRCEYRRYQLVSTAPIDSFRK